MSERNSLFDGRDPPLFVDGIGPPLQQIEEDYKALLTSTCGGMAEDVLALVAAVKRLSDALRAMRQLAGISTEGDPWYAEHEGIDADAIFKQAKAALGEEEGRAK